MKHMITKIPSRSLEKESMFVVCCKTLSEHISVLFCFELDLILHFLSQPNLCFIFFLGLMPELGLSKQLPVWLV